MALLGSDTSVTGPFPKGVLLLETLAGTEELAAPFVYELGLLSTDHNLDPDDVLGKPMAVGIKLGTSDWCHFHGVVSSFSKSDTTRLHTRYAARLVPRLSLCDYTSDCRIFNESPQDAVSIVTSVLADRDVTAVESGALTDHAFRACEICVQYQESDLHFVQRLLEEEGIYYFFRHTEEGHTMVLGDSVSAHETAPGYENVLYTPEEREAAGVDEHFWGVTRKARCSPMKEARRAWRTCAQARGILALLLLFSLEGCRSGEGARLRARQSSQAWIDFRAAVTAAFSPAFPRRSLAAMAEWGLEKGELGVLADDRISAGLKVAIPGLDGDKPAIPGFDSRRPPIISIGAESPRNSAWLLQRFQGGRRFFSQPNVPRVYARALLPAANAQVLRGSVVKSMSHSCKITPGAAGGVQLYCRGSDSRLSTLAVTEREASVEIEMVSSTSDREANGVPSPSPWPDPTAAFEAAAVALSAEDAEVIAEVVPSRIPLVRAGFVIADADDEFYERPADLTLRMGSDVLARLAMFLPDRAEIARVRLSVMATKQAPLVAEADLSAAGTSALALLRAQGGLDEAVPPSSTPYLGFACPEEADPSCEAPPIPFMLSELDMLWGTLQAPFLMMGSLAPCVASHCRDSRRLVRILGGWLGLEDVQLGAPADGTLDIAAKVKKLQRPLRVRITADSASRLHIELGVDRADFRASRRDAGAGRQEAVAPPPASPGREGTLCLESGLLHFQNVLAEYGLHPGRPRHDPTIVARELVAGQSSFDCAAAAASAEDTGREWAEAFALLTADLAHGQYALDKQLAELRRGCQKSYAEACAEIPRIERLASIQLPKTKCSCGTSLDELSPIDRSALFHQPWSPAVVRGMDRDGAVESRRETVLPRYPLWQNLVAIDARTPIKHVRAYLERREEGRSLQHQSSGQGWLQGVAQHGGKTVVLPPLYSPPEKVECTSERILAHSFQRRGADLKRPSVENLTRRCTFAEDNPVYTNVLLELPDEAKWSELVEAICKIGCTGDPFARDPEKRSPMLYLGRRPRPAGGDAALGRFHSGTGGP